MGMKGLRGRMEGQKVGAVNISGWATLPARVSGVSTQHASVYLAPGNKLLGNPISLPAAGRSSFRRGRPDLHGVSRALLSVFPCMKSPVRWRGTPLIARHSSFSTAVKSPPLVLHGMVGTLSMMAQGQMQNAAWSCKVGGHRLLSKYGSLKVLQRKGSLPVRWAFWTRFSIWN